MKNTRLPPHLQAAQEEIERYAAEYGLDFYPIIYEVLDYRSLYESASLGGFPTRYPHWRFGMEYDQLMKGHVWMGSTIYEMVINTNPSYAYLLEGNEPVTQKMVMAHVAGHVDFFKNNMWFAHTNRKMLDEMANHAARIQAIIERQGYEIVEDFIDTCLSLENLIDYHAPYIKRPDATYKEPLMGPDDAPEVEGLKVDREYMREYINPPDFLEEQRQQIESDQARQKQFPINPQKDILLFLLNYAPLERWQHTILEIIRDEAYYFAPQGMTKILNEGWACVAAETLIPTNQGLLPMGELVRHHLPVYVSDGQMARRVYDRAQFANRETVWLRTGRGFELEGSITHRVLLADGQTWRRLDELQPGDQVYIGGGTDLWAEESVPLDEQTAALLGAVNAPQTAGIPGLQADTSTTAAVVATPASPALPLPALVDEQVAAALGALVATHPDDTGVPAVILRSPRRVVFAFLQACYEHSGQVDGSGVVFATRSAALAKDIQLLLLNAGMLAARALTDAGDWHLTLTGRSAARFAEQIGFRLPHTQAHLTHALAQAGAATREDWSDAVVALEQRRADVYDISVETTHRYAAHGFINHNSFWHSQIMTQRALDSSEIISFADLHSGVVATSGGRLNPYKLGLELLRTIEERWNKGQFGKEYDECDDIAAKRNWDKQLGLGRQKIFEIRKLYNDVTFIDEFLTPEFVLEQKLFTFRYNRDTDMYEVASREFKEIKEKLLFRLTNFGQPYIVVENANQNNRGELYLVHRFEGVDLQMDYARETMRNLYKIWTRPIHLQTMVDNRKRLLSFDGSDFSERRIE